MPRIRPAAGGLVIRPGLVWAVSAIVATAWRGPGGGISRCTYGASRARRFVDAAPNAPTWRAKVSQLPALTVGGLRPAPIDAILAGQRHDRLLAQMATGAGKTFTAVTESYRLLKFGGFRRVLFLVERNTWLTRRCGSSRFTRPRTMGGSSPSCTARTS